MIDQKLGIAIFQNPEFADLAGKLMYERDQARLAAWELMQAAKGASPLYDAEEIAKKHLWLKEAR